MNRHIIVGAHNTLCPLYFMDEEILDHIFLLCLILNHIRVEGYGWIDAVVQSFSGSITACFLDFFKHQGLLSIGKSYGFLSWLLFG